MSVLFQNVLAVLTDEAGSVLPGAYVAVEGETITYVGV